MLNFITIIREIESFMVHVTAFLTLTRYMIHEVNWGDIVIKYSVEVTNNSSFDFKLLENLFMQNYLINFLKFWSKGKLSE